MLKKTKLMKRVERDRKARVELLIPRLVIEQGARKTAALLGVTERTILNWMPRFGLKRRILYVPDGYEVFVRPVKPQSKGASFG